MNVDALTKQFEDCLVQARAGLKQEISEARAAVAAANNEKTAAANALADLKDQTARANADLAAVQAHLGKASDLAGLNSMITKARTELAAIKVQTDEASQHLAKLAKDRTEGEARVNVLQNENRRLTTQQSEMTADVTRIKTLLRSFGG
jgi:chromosome segregation ATPase